MTSLWFKLQKYSLESFTRFWPYDESWKCYEGFGLPYLKLVSKLIFKYIKYFLSHGINEFKFFSLVFLIFWGTGKHSVNKTGLNFILKFFLQILGIFVSKFRWNENNNTVEHSFFHTYSMYMQINEKMFKVSNSFIMLTVLELIIFFNKLRNIF